MYFGQIKIIDNSDLNSKFHLVDYVINSYRSLDDILLNDQEFSTKYCRNSLNGKFKEIKYYKRCYFGHSLTVFIYPNLLAIFVAVVHVIYVLLVNN